MSRRLGSILAVAGLAAAPALAKTTWETRVRYRLQGNDTVAPGTSLPIFAPGTATVIVQVGIFNFSDTTPGHSNQGLNNWTATITSTGLTSVPGEHLGVDRATSRIAPFTFGPATSFGGTLVPPGTINSVNCARDVSGGGSAPWLWDTNCQCPGPIPTLPPGIPCDWPPACDPPAYTDVYRFQVIVTSATGPAIVITPTGSAGPVVAWAVFGSNPPVCDFPPACFPGNVNFIGLTPTPVLAPYTASSLTLTRCPLQITQTPGPQTIRAGEPVTLSVAAASSLPITYQWRRNGIALADNARISGSATAALTIDPTIAADAGVYDAIVTVPCGTLPSPTAILTIVCRADWDRDGRIQPADVAAFIRDWFASLQQGTLIGDYDHNGAIQPGDIGAFMNDWFAALINGC